MVAMISYPMQFMAYTVPAGIEARMPPEFQIATLTLAHPRTAGISFK